MASKTKSLNHHRPCLGVVLLLLFACQQTFAEGTGGGGESFSGARGVTITAGATHSDKFHLGKSAELGLVDFIFNAGLATTEYDSSNTLQRAYLGLGLGPEFQLQCGLGSGQGSLRVKSVTYLFEPFSSDFEFDRPKKIIPILSASAELFGPQGATVSLQIGIGW